MKPIGEPAAVGDTVDYHGTVITLNGVRESEGDEYLKPQPGHTFKVVDITVKNNGQEPLVISSALSLSGGFGNGLLGGLTALELWRSDERRKSHLGSGIKNNIGFGCTNDERILLRQGPFLCDCEDVAGECFQYD